MDRITEMLDKVEKKLNGEKEEDVWLSGLGRKGPVLTYLKHSFKYLREKVPEITKHTTIEGHICDLYYWDDEGVSIYDWKNWMGIEVTTV